MLVLGSVIVSLGGLELASRAWRGADWLVNWDNIVWEERRATPMVEPVCAYDHHPQLGWAPSPRFTSELYNIGPDRLRRMPPLPPGAAPTPAILATGDSFTEGDEVADDEAWPAYLQELVGRRVINAGVGGFGLDQTVLQTELMVAKYEVAVAVVGFIVDDLRRNELSRSWSFDKPYFELVGEELRLRNFPVPPPRAACDSLPFWQRLLGWSVLIDTVARRQGWMLAWIFDDVQALPPGTGDALACPLMRRLSSLPVPVLVVAQYDRTVWGHGVAREREQHAEALQVLRCASEAGLATLDTFDAVETAIDEQGVDSLYLYGHHSAAGNRLIAHVIAAELARLRLLPGLD